MLDIVERINTLYATVMALPVEGQVAIGIGALVIVALARNIWKLLYPVRWVAATTLRGGAWALCRRKRVARQAPANPSPAPNFDVRTTRAFIHMITPTAVRL
jgi:hypothetical protein